MKRLIVLFLCSLFVVTLISAQSATVLRYKMTDLTINGTSTDTVTFPRVMGEYDVSIQFWPALAGEGDSLNFSHILYLSDSYDDEAWTAVSSADSVDTATDIDGIAWWADLRPVRIQAILTGLSSDTVTVTPYAVYKKHANE